MDGKKRQNLLHRHLITLYMSGLLYPLSWEEDYKKILYDIFTLATAACFPVMIVLQMVYLYNHLDDLLVIIGILCQMSFFISTYTIFFYFLRHKPKLVNLIYRIETEFIFHMERVGAAQKREAILAERSEKSKHITYLMLTICFFVNVAWAVIPWIMGYVDYFIKTQEELSRVERGKYFGLVMWLPENVNKFPVYEMVQCFHFMTIYAIVSNITSCFMIMFMLTYHATTLFRVIAAAFEDIDDFVSSIKSEDKANGDIRLEFDSFGNKGSMAFNLWSKDCDQVLDEIPNEDIVKITMSRKRSEFKSTAINSNVSTVSNLQVNEIFQIQLNKYLVHCIEFHQAAIRYTEDLNDLVSPTIFIYFIFTEAMLCLTVFQFAMAKMDEKKLRLLASVITIFTWPLLLCLYGDDLKSVAVNQAVYNTQWYCQSSTYNKLIKMVIVRAQQPVCLRAGKFYVATLQTFAEICHKVYAYLTLLRQIYED